MMYDGKLLVDAIFVVLIPLCCLELEVLGENS